MKPSHLPPFRRSRGAFLSRLPRAVAELISRGVAPLSQAVAGALALTCAWSAARAQTHAAEDATHYVHLMAPVSGQHFYAPGFVRVFLSAFDLDNWPDQ